MITTLNKIRAHDPCRSGWSKLLAYLGKTKADDKPLPLLTVLDSNGLDDAVWALRSVTGYDRTIRLFACDCADSVLHLYESANPGDTRPRHAIEVSRRYADGLATLVELAAASTAAWDAAYDAAWDAAETAARAAARAAAWDAARAAAWDAARAAAETAAAARAAAETAAASTAAWDAAYDAEIHKQEALFRAMCEATQ